MSKKQFYHEIDLVSVAQLINARIMNVDLVEENRLSGELSQSNTGYVVYNTEDRRIKTWNGQSFDPLQIDVEGDVKFKGLIDASSPLDTQANFLPVFGYQYIVAVPGVLELQGYTFSPSPEVEEGDLVLVGNSDTIHVIQRNDTLATVENSGNVKIATTVETLLGENDSNIITPATLKEMIQNKKYISQSVNVVDLQENTPVTVSHNLALENKFSFVVSVTSGGKLVSADIEVLDENTIQIRSLETFGNSVVTIQGFNNYDEVPTPPVDPEDPEDPSEPETLTYSLPLSSVDQTSYDSVTIALSDDF